MSCHVTSRHVTSCHVLSRPVMSSVLVLCVTPVVSRRVTFTFCRLVLSHVMSFVMSFLMPWRRLAGVRSPDVAWLSLATKRARRRSSARRWCEGPACEDAAKQEQRAFEMWQSGARAQKGACVPASYRFFTNARNFRHSLVRVLCGNYAPCGTLRENGPYFEHRFSSHFLSLGYFCIL